MSTRNIIGFAGRARSGKTTLAKVLHEENNYKILTIANYLKKLCCKLLGDISLHELNRLKDNNIDISDRFVIDDNFINIINQETGIGCIEIKDELEKLGVYMTTVRAMLQIIGTDIIRKYYPDWHIRQLINEIETLPTDTDIAVDDVRFPNEKKEIEKVGGTVIFIMRPTMLSTVYNHPSENSLQWFQFIKKHIIINYSNQYEFISNFLEMMNNEFNEPPIKQKKYLELCKKTNSLYGIQYSNFNILQNCINCLKKENLSINENGYPYLEIQFKNAKQLLDFEEVFNLETFFGEDIVLIYNPFIIENLKLYL